MLRYVVLHLAFVVLLVAYLPGALIFRLPVAHPSRRATLAAEERVFWAVAISVGLSSLVAFGLAALGTYQLDRVLGINGLISVVAAFACWRARERRAEATPPTRTAVAPLLLVALAAAVFFAAPPAEYVNGGRDPGIYFNTGIQIAKSGSLTIDDRLVRTVPARYLDLFLRPDVTIETVDRRFLGFFVTDEETGTVVGQFLQLYPVWIAIAYDAYGLTGARYVQGLWALLGVLAVYFAGAALLGRRAAFAGAALLSINVAQVWFARFFNAEMIVQGLVFTGLLAYARAHVDAQRFFAPIAAILFGLTLFAHLLGILVVGAVSMAVILGRCAGQRVQIAFVLPLAVMTAAAAAYFVIVPWPYVLMSFQFILEQEKAPRLVVAAAVLVAAVLVAFRVTDRWTAAAAGTRIWLPRLLLASIWLLAAYALVFAEGGDRSPELNPYWLTLYTGFYLQPLGLAAALVGWSVVSGPRFWRGSALVLLSAAFAIVIFYNARITPDHFWMARRYVLIILPVSLLLAGAAAFTPVAWLDRRRVAWAGELSIGRVRVAAGIVLVAALGWQYGHTTWPILRHVEHAGMISALSGLAASLTPRDLLLVESRWLADTHTLAPPARLRSRPRRARLSRSRPRLVGLARVPRLGAPAVRPRAVHGRQRHRPAVARYRGTTHRERALSGTVLRASAERLSERRRALGVRLRHLRPGAGAIRRGCLRPRHRRRGRSLRRRHAWAGAFAERRHEPVDERPVGRQGCRYSSRHRHAVALHEQRRPACPGRAGRGASVPQRAPARRCSGDDEHVPAIHRHDPAGPGPRHRHQGRSFRPSDRFNPLGAA